ncbi:fumarylacetoacetate hydrolase family protein [Actinoplanes sichuanensis]|uniref:Fumarylacetoacetate hydrolase family protein n=1 Tax=Actinoplanes sichuanensis TaxID=512349 RepID=A0ABW4AGX4_9ACTN|nr:fumarylacetoacetate hydrolase family protein [Actinoplanes sichuanensis]BEL02438.1 fumarylacetoacetate hydrolase family protein [Actinoplanes sichuanensis]
MRYARIRLDGRPVHAEIDGDIAHLLDGSPVDGKPRRTGSSVPLGGVDFLPPVIPGVFYAVGLNYRAHIEHYGKPVPDRPEVGYRANNALTGARLPIVKPAEVKGRFEAEGELVAVIGRTLRRAGRAEAQESILGWTIGNDVSAREWQHHDRTFWRSKNSDTFKPMGPWIETDVDPLVQTTTVRIDGVVKAEFATGDMVFDPFDYLVEMTKYLTLHPGDVLWMGADSTVQLEPGSTVDIEITGIGTLSNPVVDERGTPHVQ